MTPSVASASGPREMLQQEKQAPSSITANDAAEKTSRARQLTKHAFVEIVTEIFSNRTTAAALIDDLKKGTK